MLYIRPEQMDAFRKQARSNFVADMEKHVSEFFPQIHGYEGSMRIRERISEAIDRAADFGLSGKADVCKLLNLRFMFGDDFLDRQDMQWAVDILAGTATDRMSNFYEIFVRRLVLSNR